MAVAVPKPGPAKFGSMAEKDRHLQVYAQKRPKVTNGQTTKDKISKQVSDRRWNVEGGERIRLKHASDDVCVVSSVFSKFSRALRISLLVNPPKAQLPTTDKDENAPSEEKASASSKPRLNERDRKTHIDTADESIVSCPAVLIAHKSKKQVLKLSSRHLVQCSISDFTHLAPHTSVFEKKSIIPGVKSHTNYAFINRSLLQ